MKLIIPISIMIALGTTAAITNGKVLAVMFIISWLWSIGAVINSSKSIRQ